MSGVFKQVRSRRPWVPVGPSGKRPPRSPLDKAKAHEVVWAQVAGVFEVARELEAPSFVYLIGHEDGPLKIGVAKDPIARRRGMQTGTPYPLRVEYILLGDRATEKLLHHYWESYAIVSVANRAKPYAPPGTEWFQPEVRKELLPIIETAAAEQIHSVQEGVTDLVDLARLVREAHVAHDFVLRVPDEVRQVGTRATRRAHRLSSA